MRHLACLGLFLLVSAATAADPSIVGSWIVQFDDPEGVSWSLCVTFRPDGTYDFRARSEIHGDSVAIPGRYTLEGDQLRFVQRGREPKTARVLVDQGWLRVRAPDGKPGEETELILERTPWCDGPAAG